MIYIYAFSDAFIQNQYYGVQSGKNLEYSLIFNLIGIRYIYIYIYIYIYTQVVYVNYSFLICYIALPFLCMEQLCKCFRKTNAENQCINLNSRDNLEIKQIKSAHHKTSN